MEVKGRDQVAGLPRTIQIKSSEVTEAIAEPLTAIASVGKSVLEKTPPDQRNGGALLCGRGCYGLCGSWSWQGFGELCGIK